MLSPGDLVRYTYPNDDGEEWMVVIEPISSSPQAVCIVSDYHGTAAPRVGTTYGVREENLVAESEVPDRVWAALMAWRLTR